MSEAIVIFNFKGEKTIIKCSTLEKLKNICERYASQIKENTDKICFKYNGNLINEETKFK